MPDLDTKRAQQYRDEVLWKQIRSDNLESQAYAAAKIGKWLTKQADQREGTINHTNKAIVEYLYKNGLPEGMNLWDAVWQLATSAVGSE
jgi:hypothetical protein